MFDLWLFDSIWMNQNFSSIGLEWTYSDLLKETDLECAPDAFCVICTKLSGELAFLLPKAWKLTVWLVRILRTRAFKWAGKQRKINTLTYETCHVSIPAWNILTNVFQSARFHRLIPDLQRWMSSCSRWVGVVFFKKWAEFFSFEQNRCKKIGFIATARSQRPTSLFLVRLRPEGQALEASSVCVCVCVCVREREREGEIGKKYKESERSESERERERKIRNRESKFSKREYWDREKVCVRVCFSQDLPFPRIDLSLTIKE